mmetsp:Transcript_2206/g.267  ORF Transcript_2206/g.267 Transcript_2206/m.267 type:complete len:140 (+) Transcript_2206:4269-4688(+)
MDISIANNILQSTNFDTLTQQLINLISLTLQLPDYENENRYIIDYSLELWVSCLLHKNDLIEIIYNLKEGQGAEEFIVKGLTYPKSQLVRKTFESTLTQICDKIKSDSNPPLSFFLRLLINAMPSGYIDPKENEYAEFF